MASKSQVRSLTRRSDFVALKESGHTFHVNSWLLVNWRPGQDGVIRCGWTIPGHIGSAVLRNRFKRWGREFIRRRAAAHMGGVDLNMILKRRDAGFYKGLEHKDFDVAMESLFAKIDRQLR